MSSCLRFEPSAKLLPREPVNVVTATIVVADDSWASDLSVKVVDESAGLQVVGLFETGMGKWTCLAS